MLNLIIQLFGIVLKPILSFFNFIDVPAELVQITGVVMGYVRSGIGIVNFFLPLSSIRWALDIFVSVFVIEHTYEVVMWIVRKIPLLGVK